MFRARVKICGITRVEDALMAAEAGADAIGLVFYPPSPRAVDVATAATIAQAVGPFVTVVGLFVDASAESIQGVLQQVNLHVLQFHGDESESFCCQFDRPYMKAIRMRPELDPASAITQYASASGVLFDAYRKGVPGGTGDTFDWRRVPQDAGIPLVLAGGLTPDNVAQAVTKTGVYGVDVSGGVEAAPGLKDPHKVRTFIERAGQASR